MTSATLCHVHFMPRVTALVNVDSEDKPQAYGMSALISPSTVLHCFPGAYQHEVAEARCFCAVRKGTL